MAGMQLKIDEKSIANISKQFLNIQQNLQSMANKNYVNLKINCDGINTANSSVQNISSSTRSFGSEIQSVIRRSIEWTAALIGIKSAIDAIKGGINEIISLNKSDVNIAMVTGKSVKEVESMNQGYLNTAKNLGILNSEVMAGAESWLRSGVSIDEANKNLETTSKLAKIAKESNSDMADSLIVIKNAYDLNSDALQSYASKVSLMDNQSASSSEKINKAMTYSAESFKSMGIDMDTALAMITNFSEKSAKSGESIGRGFVSMLTNFHKIQESVKSGDKEEEDAVNKLEIMLNKKGLSLRKNKDEWLDLGTVIKSIQQNINKFSDVEKSQLAFQIGGKENMELTLSTLNNMNRIDELNEKLKNDSGAKALNESYQKYMDGIEYRTNNLKNSLTQLYLNFINSNVIKSAVSGLTLFVNWLDEASGSCKKLGIALVALITTFIILVKNAKDVIAAFALIAEGEGVLATMSVLFTGLTGAVTALGKALKALFLTPEGLAFIAIAAAIGAATYAVIKHIQHQKELKEETDKLISSYQTLTEALQKNNIEQEKSASIEIKNQQKSLIDLLNQRKQLEEQIAKIEKEKQNDKQSVQNQNPYASTIDKAGSNTSGDNPYESLLNENTANVQQLSNLNTQIKEIDDTITGAGYHLDKTTGEIVELEAAENNIKLNDDLTNAQNKIKVLEKEDDNLSSLIDRYNQLSSTQNRNKTQQDELNSVIQQLQGSIEGVNVITDANGNKIIKNINVITDKKKAIEDEKNAAITAAKAEQQAVEQNTQVTIDGVNLTIAALKKKVEAYKLAINAYEAEMAASMSNNYVSNYIDKQTLEAYENYDKYKGVLDGIESSFDNLNANYSGNSSSSSGSYEPPGSSSSSKEKYTDTIALLDQYKHALDSVSQSLTKYDTQLTLLTDQEKLYKDKSDFANALKTEAQILDENSHKLDAYKSAYTQTQKIFSQIQAQFKKDFSVSVSSFTSQSDLDYYYNKLFGGAHNFASQAQEDAFKKREEEFKNLMSDLTSAQSDLNKYSEEQLQIEQAIIDAVNEQNSLYEERNKIYDDMESKEESAIKKVVEDKKSALDEEYNYMQKTIQAEMDLLDKEQIKESDLKNLRDNAASVAEIQSQLNALGMNDSPEEQSKRADLKKQLKEAEQKQNDELNKQNVQNEKNALQQQLDDEKTKTDNKKAQLDQLYTDMNVKTMAQQALVDGFFKDIDGHVTTLIDGFKLLGETIDNSFISNLQIAQQIANGSIAKGMSKNIYGNSTDLTNAQSIFGSGYNYIDISKDKNWQSQINSNDIFLGGTGIASNSAINGALRLGGTDRNATKLLMQLLAQLLNSLPHYADGSSLLTSPQLAVVGDNPQGEAILNLPQIKGLLTNATQSVLSNFAYNFKSLVPAFNNNTNMITKSSPVSVTFNVDKLIGTEQGAHNFAKTYGSDIAAYIRR